MRVVLPTKVNPNEASEMIRNIFLRAFGKSTWSAYEEALCRRGVVLIGKFNDKTKHLMKVDTWRTSPFGSPGTDLDEPRAGQIQLSCGP